MLIPMATMPMTRCRLVQLSELVQRGDDETAKSKKQ